MDGLACEYQLVDLSSEGPHGGYRTKIARTCVSSHVCSVGAGPACRVQRGRLACPRAAPPAIPPPTPRGLFPRSPFTRNAAPAPTQPPAAAHPPGRAPFPAATLTRASTAAAALRVALRRRPRAGAGGRSIHRPAAASGIKLPPSFSSRARPWHRRRAAGRQRCRRGGGGTGGRPPRPSPWPPCLAPRPPPSPSPRHGGPVHHWRAHWRWQLWAGLQGRGGCHRPGGGVEDGGLGERGR